MSEERLLTETELLDALNIQVDRTAVWRWRKKGMPHIKIGKAIRYELAAVREWLAQQQPEAPPFETYFTAQHVDDVAGVVVDFTMGLRRLPGGEVEQLLEIRPKRKGGGYETEQDFRELIVTWLEGMAGTIDSGKGLTVVFKDVPYDPNYPVSEEG